MLSTLCSFILSPKHYKYRHYIRSKSIRYIHIEYTYLYRFKMQLSASVQARFSGSKNVSGKQNIVSCWSIGIVAGYIECPWIIHGSLHTVKCVRCGITFVALYLVWSVVVYDRRVLWRVRRTFVCITCCCVVLSGVDHCRVSLFMQVVSRGGFVELVPPRLLLFLWHGGLVESSWCVVLWCCRHAVSRWRLRPWVTFHIAKVITENQYVCHVMWMYGVDYTSGYKL